MSHHDLPPDGDCTACGLDPDRRTFLRESAATVAAVLMGLGAARADALAPLAFTRPLSASAGTRTYAIPARDGAEIDRENEVIVARWQNAVYAFALACPHQNTALRWFGDQSIFQCPKHKSKYRPDGSFISGRATRGMDRHGIRRAGNAVTVDLEALYEQDENAAAWNAAVVRLA